MRKKHYETLCIFSYLQSVVQPSTSFARAQDQPRPSGARPSQEEASNKGLHTALLFAFLPRDLACSRTPVGSSASPLFSEWNVCPSAVCAVHTCLTRTHEHTSPPSLLHAIVFFPLLSFNLYRLSKALLHTVSWPRISSS